MLDPANPHGYVGGWTLYATRCGHPISHGETEQDCLFFWHDFDFDFDHGHGAGPSKDTERHSGTRPATQSDLDALRRGDSCNLCNLCNLDITT